MERKRWEKRQSGKEREADRHKARQTEKLYVYVERGKLKGNDGARRGRERYIDR